MFEDNKLKVNHPLTIVFLSLVVVFAVFVLSVLLFSPLGTLIVIGLFFLIVLLLLQSLLNLAWISFVQDFSSYVQGIVTLKVGKDSSRFLGMKNYTIPNSKIMQVIKSRFLFLHFYTIFYYREKSLSFAKAVILFRNIERNISREKVVVLPGLFSYFWLSYVGIQLSLLLFKKKLKYFNYLLTVYFGKPAIKKDKILSDKALLEGGAYVCDYRYAKQMSEEIRKKGYLGIEPLHIMKLYFRGYGTWPFAKMDLSQKALQLQFMGYPFAIPWENIKEVSVNKNLTGKSLIIVHNFEGAPQGITFYSLGDIKEPLRKLRKYAKVT